MILKEIQISNFRSIENVIIKIEPVNGSNTFTLIGINESGKSSILKAISLFEGGSIAYPSDYNNVSKSVQISFIYTVTNTDLDELEKELMSKYKLDINIIKKINPEEVRINVDYSPSVDNKSVTTEIIKFREPILKGYNFADNIFKIVPKNTLVLGKSEIDLNEFFEINLTSFFWTYTHVVTLWKSSSEYLITDEIDLVAFANNPKSSIPLMNCFKLAKINEEHLLKEIEKLNSAVEITSLQDLLGYKVTEHINNVWKNHPINIRFQIDGKKLSFLVEDKNVKYKSKTASQRSDGFKQFISFLLTISAKNHSKELETTILLLDEPETHLHPTAQIYLMNELIKISKNLEYNNVVIYATHSNYMIDKSNIHRSFKIIKEKNEQTVLTKIGQTNSSYSEVNFEVFDIPTNDYHNELYGFLEDMPTNPLNKLLIDRSWENELHKKTENVSLAKYIRNSIHHPENTSNPKFTEKELLDSINTLRELKYPKIGKKK